MNHPTVTTRLLTAEEAAAYLGVVPRTLRTLRETGRLPAVKLGEKILRYDLRDLDDYIESVRRGGVAVRALHDEGPADGIRRGLRDR